MWRVKALTHKCKIPVGVSALRLSDKCVTIFYTKPSPSRRSFTFRNIDLYHSITELGRMCACYGDAIAWYLFRICFSCTHQVWNIDIRGSLIQSDLRTAHIYNIPNNKSHHTTSPGISLFCRRAAARSGWYHHRYFRLVFGMAIRTFVVDPL